MLFCHRVARFAAKSYQAIKAFAINALKILIFCPIRFVIAAVSRTAVLLIKKGIKFVAIVWRIQDCSYDSIAQKLILNLKFHDRTDLASVLAKMMYVAGKDIFASGVDVIIPVPLHYTRILKRKYNQSALLAKELGRLTGIKVCYDVLTKSRMTRPQVECSGFERLNNVKGAFLLKNSEKIKGKRVLLIDDVLTTGSTIKECKECALAIKKAHPKSIDNLTIARVV